MRQDPRSDKSEMDGIVGLKILIFTASGFLLHFTTQASPFGMPSGKSGRAERGGKDVVKMIDNILSTISTSFYMVHFTQRLTFAAILNNDAIIKPHNIIILVADSSMERKNIQNYEMLF